MHRGGSKVETGNTGPWVSQNSLWLSSKGWKSYIASLTSTAEIQAASTVRFDQKDGYSLELTVPMMVERQNKYDCDLGEYMNDSSKHFLLKWPNRGALHWEEALGVSYEFLLRRTESQCIPRAEEETLIGPMWVHSWDSISGVLWVADPQCWDRLNGENCLRRWLSRSLPTCCEDQSLHMQRQDTGFSLALCTLICSSQDLPWKNRDHNCNPSTPTGRWEMETEKSPEARRPASLVCAVETNRWPCLKQSRRWGLISKVMFWLPNAQCDICTHNSEAMEFPGSSGCWLQWFCPRPTHHRKGSHWPPQGLPGQYISKNRTLATLWPWARYVTPPQTHLEKWGPKHPYMLNHGGD